MNIFKDMVKLLQAKESFVVATILHRCGSAPRGVGSRMIVREDGSIIGSVGGGILEATVQKRAAEIFSSRKTLVSRFSLNRDGKVPIGMICGGDVDVLLHYEDGSRDDRRALYEDVKTSLDSRKRAWLVMRLPDGEVGETAPQTYIFNDGNASLEAEGVARFRELLVEVSTQPDVVAYGEKRFYIEPLSSGGAAYIFGAGHVGQKLAELTAFVGFRTVVLDDREEFASRERLRTSDEILVLESFDEAMKGLQIDRDSYIVIVTRGHVHDKTVLEQALRTDAGYIGMIGSRKKRDATFEVLAREGFDENDFARVHAPIGLDIRAETPEEIAVSIVAELIQARARNL